MNVFLKGNYQGYFTKLKIHKLSVSSRYVLVNVHGLYGASGEPFSKSTLLGNSVLKHGLAHVVHFSSSRNWQMYQNAKNFSDQIDAFQGKSFEQELQDLKETINLLLTNSTELFDQDGKNIQFLLIGSSLGGTVISSLGEKLQWCHSIVMCGSGIGPSTSGKPILSSYPSKQTIRQSTERFKGSVLLLQGSKDDVVPLFSGDELLGSYINARMREKKLLEGVNHNFSNINGRNKQKAKSLYISTILDFVENSLGI